jgi:hypothetical protein
LSPGPYGGGILSLRVTWSIHWGGEDEEGEILFSKREQRKKYETKAINTRQRYFGGGGEGFHQPKEVVTVIKR